MPGELTLYSFEDKNGDESGCYTTQDFEEAKAHAMKYRLRLIENVYEWTEAVPYPGCDFTEDEDGNEGDGTNTAL